MIPFDLEDFFDKYEHQSGLINLASSDALPWTSESLLSAGIALPDFAKIAFSYPDTGKDLLPALCRFCSPPADVKLLPTSGAAEAIALTIHEHADALASRDKGLIGVPSPAYGAFAGLANLLQLKSKSYLYHPDRHWTPNQDELVELAKQCSALVVTNPHNPTGHVLLHEFLQTLADELASKGSLLIVDEVFLEEGTPSATSLRGNVVVIGSLSKTYGLPGLRFGWIATDENRRKRLRTLQQYLTLTTSSLTAGIAAILLDQSAKLRRTTLIQENRKAVVGWASTIAGHGSISRPLGGSTVCLTVKAQVSEQIIFDALLGSGVLLAPGARCFGLSFGRAWFRLGYGGATQALHDGLARVSEVLSRST